MTIQNLILNYSWLSPWFTKVFMTRLIMQFM